MLVVLNTTVVITDRKYSVSKLYSDISLVAYAPQPKLIKADNLERNGIA